MSTDFIGPREGWEEHNTGTIRIEIDMELWSNSGRPKHMDIDEQGAWIAESIRSFLKDTFSGKDDVALHGLRYFGEVTPTTDGAVLDNDIGAHPN